MILIFEGHTIDTKEIWCIKDLYETTELAHGDKYTIGITIGLIDKPDLTFKEIWGRDSHGDNLRKAQYRYNDAIQPVIDAWNKDKTEIPIYKL